MVVNEQTVAGANGVQRAPNTPDVQVACRYAHGIADPDVYKITRNSNSQIVEQLLNNDVQTKTTQSYMQRTYMLTGDDKQGTATYRCIDKNYENKPGCPDYSQVTISFTGVTPSPGPFLRSNCRPGGSADIPSVDPPTSTSPNHPTASSSSKYILYKILCTCTLPVIMMMIIFH